MKMIIATLATLVTIQAEARSLHPDTFTQVSQLTHFYPDSQLSTTTKISTGTVSVNAATREVVLVLNRVVNCPPNRACPKYIPAPTVVRLPILNIKRDDRCGVVTYNAAEDKRIVDGNLEVITVVDNSENKCQSGTAGLLTETVVTHKTVTAGMDGKVGRYTSKFYGTRLLNIGLER